MALPFARYLRSALRRKGLSQRAFARAVGYKQANVQQICAGRRPVPLAHITRWRRALGDAVDPRDFEMRAHLDHAPPYVCRLVRRLERQLARAQRA